MSAGICIMNKNAIALAADSAVTVGQHLAIHNSANKLFAVSKIAPVGAIVYADAELMNIPIEIIFKQYKKKLSHNTFSTLEEYVSDFFVYLVDNRDFYRFATNEKPLVNHIYTNLLNGLDNDYQRLIKEKIEIVKRDLDDVELQQIENSAIESTIEFVNNLTDIPEFDVQEYIKATYGNDIQTDIKNKFPWITESTFTPLCEAVYKVFNKQFFRNGYVGIAFAGYGENEIFAQMVHLHISGVINNKVRYIQTQAATIDEVNPATITPLAQTDVMQTFLFGINDRFISDIARELPQQIKTDIQELDDSYFAENKKAEVQCVLNRTANNIIEQILSKARIEYLFPITQSIATLPIEELALLAESMINITSLRRKVALDNNIGTVGGPIDVAIISKHDGFIWLKRKHYFKNAYNPQYFYSHYHLSEGGHSDETAPK